jgi:hypothetical protein
MVRHSARRPEAGATKVRRVLRDLSIFGSFAREAARQRLPPEDVMRQLMLAYVTACTHPDPVALAAWQVSHPPHRHGPPA